MNIFDKDMDREINKDEFFELWTYLSKWRKTFKKLDKNNSKSIDKEELKLALKEHGHDFSQQLINQLYKRFNYSPGKELRF